MKLAAGWLIEKAGLKGLGRGAAAACQQALVLVNQGGAQAEDPGVGASCSCRVLPAILPVELVPEVRFIGAQGEILLDEGAECAI